MDRIEAAREIQRRRFSNGKTPAGQTALQPSTLTLQPVACNSDMRPAEVRQYCVLDDTRRSLIRTAMSQLTRSFCAALRPRLPPGSQAGAHDRRPGGE